MATALKKLIDELSQQLGSVMQSKKKIDSMVDAIAETEATIDSVAGVVSGSPGPAALVEFHKIKLPGKYGSYGTTDRKAKLMSMSTSLANEATFLNLAIGVYNNIDKGVDLPVFLPEDIPGYDALATYPYNKDKDHPMSIEKLLSGPDIHLQNRPEDRPSRLLRPKCIWPDVISVGDIICSEGVVYIADKTQSFFPLGLQEPTDDVCGIMDNYNNPYYKVCHASCEDEGGGE